MGEPTQEPEACEPCEIEIGIPNSLELTDAQFERLEREFYCISAGVITGLHSADIPDVTAKIKVKQKFRPAGDEDPCTDPPADEG